MKTLRFFLVMAAMLLAASSADAQNTMRVHQKDGTVHEYTITDVEFVDWYEKTTPEGEGTEPVYEDIDVNGTTYHLGISGAIDLGIGVKWAAYNVGAEAPGEYGDYFAWGETTGYKDGKTTFGWSTYKYMQEGYSDYNHVTKYTTEDGWTTGCWYDGDTYVGTTVDGVTYKNKTQLDAEDDVAHVKWQGDWRMPTKAELDDLRTKCTWVWTTYGGHNGYVVVGSTGSAIFLPAAGGRDDSRLIYAGSCGYYWSSSLSGSGSCDAYNLSFSSGDVDWYDGSRYCGRSVRPVCP